MKASRKITAVFFLLIAIVITLGWWVSKPEKPSQQPTNTDSKPTPHVAETVQSPTQVDNTSQMVQPFARTPYLGVNDPRWKEYWQMREADRGHEWNTPIEFFGKVVDENNQPVEGATVNYEWIGSPEKYGGDGVVKEMIQSDANGAFYIHGIEGKRMIIHVKKRGYKVRGYPQGSYEYAGFWEPRFIEPDRNKPIIFRLVKRPEGEPTFHIGFRSIPKPPNWITKIDFLAQPAETNGEGDIALQILRPWNPGYRTPFDWQLKIEARGGAEVMFSNDEFMLHAPVQGYENAIIKDYSQMRGSGVETVRFYVRNKARKFYAAVSVEITPYYPRPLTKEDTACYIISATVNPNDSPNVDYNEKLDIRRVENK